MCQSLRPGSGAIWPLLALAAFAFVLSGCSGADYKPPTKPPVPAQIAYRIDDHRYFEITPNNDCYGDMLYFVDTAKGIRSDVVRFDAVMNGSSLVIDAANNEYLIGPVTRGSTNCSSGGGRCGERLPYSVDGGLTWKRAWYPGYGDDLVISGATVYRSFRIETVHTDMLDLASGPTPADTHWRSAIKAAPQPLVSPTDVKVRCRPPPDQRGAQ